MLTTKKSQIEKLLEPFVEPLSGVNPNILTLLGSIPPILFFVSVLNHHYVWAMLAFLGSGIDLIDGMIARKYKKVTDFGGFFDSLMDRVSDFLYITAFSFAGIVRWEIVTFLLLFSFLTSYIRSRAGLAAKNHMEFAVGMIERPERLGFILAALVSYIFFPYTTLYGISVVEWIFIILTFLSLITVIQRTLHAYKKL
jgi:phosphatidylglycerophosphate synthase